MARSYTDVYDSYLHLQAHASFGLEQRIFAAPAIATSTTVLDLGCGNGTYASLLARRYPLKRVIAIEPDEGLLSRGQCRSVPCNLEFIPGSLEVLHEDFRCDLLVARLVMMYLQDPAVITTWAGHHADTAIVIDPADDLFLTVPELPYFEENERQNAQRIASIGAGRTVDTVSLWTDAGFTLDAEYEIIIQSTDLLTKGLLHHMMVLFAELTAGSPLVPEFSEELFSWYLDESSYVQYGLKARRFLNGIMT